MMLSELMYYIVLYMQVTFLEIDLSSNRKKWNKKRRHAIHVNIDIDKLRKANSRDCATVTSFISCWTENIDSL